jgi:putative glutamine amidotransferase
MRIGITSSYRIEDGAPKKHPKLYVAAVEALGAEAVLLENDAARVAEQLGELAGVIVGGGADVEAWHYGGRAELLKQPTHPERDAFEIALLRALRERRIPTLCICRGIQVANVAFGGTLIEDIPAALPTSTIEHSQPDRGDDAGYARAHDVTVTPDSLLARIVRELRFTTNAHHHQAIGELAPDLRAVAWADDGVVEAVEAAFEHPFFLGVQWHPEEPPRDAISARIFAGFAAVAGRVAAPR